MTKLDELIQEYCPDGVEYKRLGDIATISRGGSFQKKDYTENGIPCIHYGQIYMNYGLFAEKTLSYISEETAQKQRFAESGDIIMAVTSENIDDVCKCMAWLGKEKVAVSGHTAIIRHSINPKYLVYWLHSSAFYQQKAKIAHGTKVIDVAPVKLADVILPVPPLPVQREIVRILDNFTELTAELTARKQQYAYYRDKLLHNATTTVYKRLGDFCDLLSGFPFDSSKFKKDGIRLMRGMNIKRGYLDFAEENNRYWESTDGIEKYLLNDQDIVISMDGSLVGSSYGMVSKKDLPLLLVQRVTRIRTNQANIRYVYHYIASGRFTEYVHKKKTAGAIPHISLKDISNFEVPLPSLEVQKRLVEVLDNFDSICTDLNIGLPAEIEARQKQYEFYRDQLLTFAAQGETILTDRRV